MACCAALFLLMFFLDWGGGSGFVVLSFNPAQHHGDPADSQRKASCGDCCGEAGTAPQDYPCYVQVLHHSGKVRKIFRFTTFSSRVNHDLGKNSNRISDYMRTQVHISILQCFNWRQYDCDSSHVLPFFYRF